MQNKRTSDFPQIWILGFLYPCLIVRSLPIVSENPEDGLRALISGSIGSSARQVFALEQPVPCGEPPEITVQFGSSMVSLLRTDSLTPNQILGL